jgi:hypothetical protein
MLLVRCLVRFAKRNEKDTGNMVPHKPGLPADSQTSCHSNMAPHLYDVSSPLLSLERSFGSWLLSAGFICSTDGAWRPVARPLQSKLKPWSPERHLLRVGSRQLLRRRWEATTHISHLSPSTEASRSAAPSNAMALAFNAFTGRKFPGTCDPGPGHGMRHSSPFHTCD